MVLTLAAVACCCIGAAAVFKVFPFLLEWFVSKRDYHRSSIPGPTLSSHLTGHIPDILGSRGPWKLLEWSNTYGPIFKVMFLDAFTVVLTDPDTIMRITRKTGPGPYMPKPHKVYEVMETSYNPPRPNILTSEDGDYWKAIRQATAPCFSVSNLKQVVPVVLELTHRAAAHMAQHDVVDVSDAAKRITSDIMGHLLYGEDLRGTYWEPSEYLQVLYPVLKAQSALFNNPFHLWMLWDAEVRHQRRCLAQHDQLMKEKVRRLRKQPPAPYTIAAHILSAIHPSTGKPLDDSHAIGEISVFMAAGFETTSHAITWCLTMLSCCPDVQQQVCNELQAAGLAPTGDSTTPGRDFQASDLGRLPLLSAVIKECLRLCPPVPFGGSRYIVNEEGADLCGHHVPKGAIIMMSLLPYGHAKHIYGDDVLEFKPQRWLTADGATLSPRQPASPTPEGPASPTSAAQPPPDPLTFMTGPRDCVGQNLAKLELQVVLATLLSRFAFSPGPELERELQVVAATGQPVVKAVHALAVDAVTMQPLGGHMYLKISPRC